MLGAAATTIIVVERQFDVYLSQVLDSCGGSYFVLGGVISPVDGIGPDDLRIAELIQHISEKHIQHVMLALGAGLESDATSMFILRELRAFSPNLKITRWHIVH